MSNGGGLLNTMKIYKKKLWPTLIKERGLVITLIIIIPYSVLFLYVYDWAIIAITALSISFIGINTFFLLLAIVAHMNYIIIDEEKFILQNGGFHFMRKEWDYNQIKQINIVCYNNIEHIQIITDKKKSIRYAVRLVETSDFYEIISIIKQKGLLGNTEGMEKYL